MLDVMQGRPFDDCVFEMSEPAGIRHPRCSNQLLSPEEVSELARDWWDRKLATGVEKAADGEVKLTLFHRLMPADWLWTQTLLLPVIAAVGGWRTGTNIQLHRDPQSLSGYVLDAKVPVDERMLDAGYECAKLEHHRIHPNASGRLPSGHHVEFMWLWDANGFCDALGAQGKEAFHVFPKVFARLPISFYDNPDLLLSKFR